MTMAISLINNEGISYTLTIWIDDRLVDMPQSSVATLQRRPLINT